MGWLVGWLDWVFGITVLFLVLFRFFINNSGSFFLGIV